MEVCNLDKSRYFSLNVTEILRSNNQTKKIKKALIPPLPNLRMQHSDSTGGGTQKEQKRWPGCWHKPSKYMSHFPQVGTSLELHQLYELARLVCRAIWHLSPKMAGFTYSKAQITTENVLNRAWNYPLTKWLPLKRRIATHTAWLSTKPFIHHSTRQGHLRNQIPCHFAEAPGGSNFTNFVRNLSGSGRSMKWWP